MPVSSKRIIAHLKALTEPVTPESLLQGLDEAKRRRQRTEVRKKKGPGRSRKEVAKAASILNDLAAAGFLQKKRGKYVPASPFRLEGVLRLQRANRGVFVGVDGQEVLVKGENLGRAHNDDYVLVDVVDCRHGEVHGVVRDVLRRSRELFFAKVTGKTRRGVHLSVMDLPGGLTATAPRAAGEPDEGHYAIIRLDDHIEGGEHACAIVDAVLPDEESYDFSRVVIKHALPEAYPAAEEYERLRERITRIDPRRKNYRELFTVTIDGEHAKDFDDAISLETVGGKTVLYVHIADVAHFVDRGSALDREALRRGNSYYLGRHVIPMLPEVLSNDLCSLRAGEDRLAVTAEMEIGADGAIVASRFFEGVILVDHRLTYRSADELIGSDDGSDLSARLRAMHELALRLKKKRLADGRIDLNLPDEDVRYDGVNIADIGFATRYRSHAVVEEFMLSANEAVSKALRENDIPTLYRVHEPIADEKLEMLRRFLAVCDITLERRLRTGVALQKVVDSVAGREYEQVVNFIVLKSMMQAYYDEKPLGHFGLGFADYTHFTSPIRRYPDLVVHRCLKSLIFGAKPPYGVPELVSIGETASDTERTAMRAERDFVKIKACRLLASRVGQVFDCIVSGVSKYGIYVTLIDKPIEGMVPLRTLTDDYYLVQEDDYMVVGKRLGRRFRLGDRVSCRLIAVELEMMRIDFEMQ